MKQLGGQGIGVKEISNIAQLNILIMDDKGTVSRILTEVRRGLVEENLPLDEVLDDLELEGIIDVSEREAIDEEQEKDQLKKLFVFLKKKPDLPLAYKAFRTQLMKHARKVKPIEDKHNYNKGSSGETNQEADEGVKPSIQVVHPHQRVQDESLDSSTYMAPLPLALCMMIGAGNADRTGGNGTVNWRELEDQLLNSQGHSIEAQTPKGWSPTGEG
ncbi:uncharacterized protein [Amphiura filiformis]|uniref:uncharacterized protein n=1 Tax=Amphiura filiformis TaxID=82378 RepID=UPI003B20B97E